MKSVITFKIKRKLERFSDFFKELFKNFLSFFHKTHVSIREHKITHHVNKARREITNNIKENNQNWIDRLASSEGFKIQDEDV